MTAARCGVIITESAGSVNVAHKLPIAPPGWAGCRHYQSWTRRWGTSHTACLRSLSGWRTPERGTMPTSHGKPQCVPPGGRWRHPR